jgi:hypothetical protein
MRDNVQAAVPMAGTAGRPAEGGRARHLGLALGLVLPAQQIGQPPAEEQEPAKGQGVGADDPLQPGRREAQSMLDGRQRQGHDRHVDDHQELGQQDQSQR